jgi:hypothetical protein
MNRPRVFISSTIADLRDLRSALKYHLEERGCTVLASEFADFEKPLDRHAFDACLESISTCDYYILVVGSRRGAWFDEAGRTSITQREYRHAYDLAKLGRLKTITFVRAEVWQLRDSLDDLATLLGQGSAQPLPATRFHDDAEFLRGFIDEIGRVAETEAAVKGHAPFPTANWIHIFSTFRDVIDVLNGRLVGGLPVDEAAQKRVLRHALLEVLRQCLLKSEGGLLAPHSSVERFRTQFELTDQTRNLEFVTVPAEAWRTLSTYMMHWLGRKLQPRVLHDVLSTPLFISFEPKTERYSEDPSFEVLYRLVEDVLNFNATVDTVLPTIFKYSPRALGGRDHGPVRMQVSEIAPFVGSAYTWCNIVSRCTALLSVIEGRGLPNLRLLPVSPVRDFDQAIAAEVASAAEVEGVFDQLLARLAPQ